VSDAMRRDIINAGLSGGFHSEPVIIIPFESGRALPHSKTWPNYRAP
jgi:hypothetical protein